MTCNASQPRRGPSARAAQILLIGYVPGFAVSVATAIAALTAGTSDGSSTSDAPSAALAGYLFLLALALLAAVVSMRAARRRLGLHAVDLGLRATPVTRRRAAAAAVMYIGLLAAAIEVTITVLDWCGVSGSGVDAGVTQAPGGPAGRDGALRDRWPCRGNRSCWHCRSRWATATATAAAAAAATATATATAGSLGRLRSR